MSIFDSIIASVHDRQEIPVEASLSHLFSAKSILSAPIHVNWELRVVQTKVILVDIEIQFQSRFGSDPTFSDIDLQNKMTWILITLK